jgi:drug/metabolite transporter (DMT)-like permease
MKTKIQKKHKAPMGMYRHLILIMGIIVFVLFFIPDPVLWFILFIIVIIISIIISHLKKRRKNKKFKRQ